MNAAVRSACIQFTEEQVRAYLRVSHSPLSTRIVQPVARRLLAGLMPELNTRSAQDWKGSLEALLLKKLEPLILEALLNEDEALWLLTDHHLKAHLKPKGSESSRDYSEKLMGDAIIKLEGGRQPLRELRAKYQEANGSPSSLPPVMAYLTTSLHNALRDQLRKKGVREDFLAPKLAAQDTRGDDDAGPVYVLKSSQNAEVSLLRRQRAQQRVEALELLRAYARRKNDKPSQLFLIFLAWKEEDPDDPKRDQLRFAEHLGKPSGSINSDLKRFRDRFQEDYQKQHNTDFPIDELGTVGGTKE